MEPLRSWVRISSPILVPRRTVTEVVRGDVGPSSLWGRRVMGEGAVSAEAVPVGTGGRKTQPMHTDAARGGCRGRVNQSVDSRACQQAVGRESSSVCGDTHSSVLSGRAQQWGPLLFPS